MAAEAVTRRDGATARRILPRRRTRGAGRGGSKRSRRARLYLALCLWLTSPVAAAAQEDTAHPLIERLRTELAGDTAAALAVFWREAAAAGTPLIARGPDSCDCIDVTFVWRGGNELSNVAVFGGASGWSAPGHLLHRLDGTDVWYRAYRIPASARFTYRVSVNDNMRPFYDDPDWAQRNEAFQLDPLNPRVVSLGGPARASFFVGPDAPPEPFLGRRPGVPRGERVRLSLESAALGETREVVVHRPATADAGGGKEPALLVVLDGSVYIDVVGAPDILDNMIASGALPPTVAVFVPSADRSGDMGGNPDFAAFLARELVPEVRRRFGGTADPGRTVILGASLGGLAAAFTALRHPDVFGNVASHSGAFWWSPTDDPEPEWLARRFAETPRQAVRFYMDVGSLESGATRTGLSMLDVSRHMRDVLCARGYPVAYREFDGDHAYVNWRVTFPDALATLLGTADTPPAPGRAGRWRRCGG